MINTLRELVAIALMLIVAGLFWVIGKVKPKG